MHTYTTCIQVVPQYGGAVVLWTTHKNSYQLRRPTVF